MHQTKDARIRKEADQRYQLPYPLSALVADEAKSVSKIFLLFYRKKERGRLLLKAAFLLLLRY